MKIVISSIVFFGLLFLPACGEEKSKPEKVSTLKSPKHETIQNLQKKRRNAWCI